MKYTKKKMKCKSCIYEITCYLLHCKYKDLIQLIAEITDAHEPEYTNTCTCVKSIFDSCHYYKEKRR